VRLGVVLALFSFVGFESATTLGAEARNPLRTIPRAVLQSAVCSGFFFCIAAYLLTAGMHALGQDLGKSTAPMTVLSGLVHVPVFGILINIGTLISMFAATLACISAAARVLLRMATNGLLPERFAVAHAKNATPAAAVLLVGLLTTLPVAVLAGKGVAGADIYGWLGSLAVYGFITIYALAAIALPFYLRRNHHLTAGTVVLSIVAALAMLLAFVGTLYPVPTEAPYNWLPLVYFAYIGVGAGWFYVVRRRAAG
jgi:amino acid transporter